MNQIFKLCSFLLVLYCLMELNLKSMQKEIFNHVEREVCVLADESCLELLFEERAALYHSGDVGWLRLSRDQLNRLACHAMVIAFVPRCDRPGFDVAAGFAADQAFAAPGRLRDLAEADRAQGKTARGPKGVINRAVVFQTTLPGFDQIRVSANR